MAKKCVEHTKVYSGLYQATNPPRWSWICDNCGEVGRDEAHSVDPKDFKRFARVMVHFHPDEKWWAKQVGRDRPA